MKLTSKLPTLLAAHKLNQKTLAAKTRLSPTTISKLARGDIQRIDQHTLLTLLRFFNLNAIDDLIGIAHDPPPPKETSATIAALKAELNAAKAQLLALEKR